MLMIIDLSVLILKGLQIGGNGMNEFYKILVMFHSGEKIPHTRLLKIAGVTEELISQTEKLGYIQKTIPTDDGEIRYVITRNGIEKRDR